jgi:hypothetical protein
MLFFLACFCDASPDCAKKRQLNNKANWVFCRLAATCMACVLFFVACFCDASRDCAKDAS